MNRTFMAHARQGEGGCHVLVGGGGKELQVAHVTVRGTFGALGHDDEVWESVTSECTEEGRTSKQETRKGGGGGGARRRRKEEEKKKKRG